MRIDIITIFPKMFAPVLNESIIKRSQAKGKAKIFVHDLRDFTDDKHRKVDDRPFGGGPGMVMRPEPVFNAVEYIKQQTGLRQKKGVCKNRRSPAKGGVSSRAKVILLSARGKKLNQKFAKELAKNKRLILICGHYEGIDERVREYLIDEEISIGDYILTGGELPAMVFIDCIIRLLPGVLGERKSLHFESFEDNLLEYSQYTRPANFRGMKVPAVLLSGDHQRIERWRQEQAVRITRQTRPDLLNKNN